MVSSRVIVFKRFKYAVAAFFSLLFWSCGAYAEKLADYISHQTVTTNGKVEAVILTTSRGKVQLSALSPYAMEVVNKTSSFNQAADKLPSFSIKDSITKQSLSLEESAQSIIISAGEIQAKIQKSPFTIRYYIDEQLLLAENGGFFEQTTDEKQKIKGVRFALADDEKLIGGGERVLGMDRRGHRMPLYNRAHYGYETHSNQMNFSLPAVMSNKKYILLFDNSAKGWMDLGKTQADVMQFEAVSGRNAYVVFAGKNYPQLINNYVDVTGKQPLPPRWALGNFASRFGYHSAKEVEQTVNQFFELDIPLDAVIIDLFWFGKDIKGHMGNLAWDKEAFPEPEKMMADLQAKGIKTVLITEPFVLSSSKRWDDAVKQDALAKNEQGGAKQFDFYFGNTGLVDIFNQQGRDWFNRIYQSLDQQGVKGWWGDLGEPEVHPSDTLHQLDNGDVVNADAIHNVYGHEWAKLVYNQQKQLHPNERPFILMRSGFAGSQRYGMLPWTGDVNRSWGGLKPQVELSLQMGLLGLAYTHSDLGGFAGGESVDAELYTRWLQYGVFQPIYRPHGQEHIPSELVFHDEKTQNILREFIKLRYRLMPYIYTMAYQNSTTGMPLMRPLFFEDEQSFDNSQSYFWGDSFFVHPIVNAGEKTVTVDVPKGIWFDYFSGKRYSGGKKYQLPTSLATIPVMVRAGAFIPMANDMPTTEHYNNSQLTLHYYADKSVTSSQGQMYDDDGKNANALSTKQYQLLNFSAQYRVKNSVKNSEQALTINLNKTGLGYQGMPAKREVSLVIHNQDKEPKKVMHAGNELKDFSWNENEKTLTVNFLWQAQNLSIKVL